jgi:hypothetical protein
VCFAETIKHDRLMVEAYTTIKRKSKPSPNAAKRSALVSHDAKIWLVFSADPASSKETIPDGAASVLRGLSRNLKIEKIKIIRIKRMIKTLFRFSGLTQFMGFWIGMLILL